jgi:hypothetical protein
MSILHFISLGDCVDLSNTVISNQKEVRSGRRYLISPTPLRTSAHQNGSVAPYP